VLGVDVSIMQNLIFVYVPSSMNRYAARQVHNIRLHRSNPAICLP